MVNSSGAGDAKQGCLDIGIVALELRDELQANSVAQVLW
jgi:hypothetical protein